MMYNEIADTWAAMPGLHVSMPRSRFDPARQRACGYINGVLNPLVSEVAKGDARPDFLYSFMGRLVHSTRIRLYRMKHPRGHVEDTGNFNYFTGSPMSGCGSNTRCIATEWPGRSTCCAPAGRERGCSG
jgi:hypothetical protein